MSFSPRGFYARIFSSFGLIGDSPNIVYPGPIQTGYLEPDDVQEINKNTPLRRVGVPTDIADVMVFLASDQSRWVTGQLMGLSPNGD